MIGNFFRHFSNGWKLLLGGLALLIAAGWAGAETTDDILAAARNIGLDNTPYNEALVLKHINQIHQLRAQNRLGDAEYQRVMAWHQIENLAMARRAAADACSWADEQNNQGGQRA